MGYQERKKRPFEELNNADEVMEILKTKFSGKKMHLKYDLLERDVEINEFLPNNEVMLITPEDYNSPDKLLVVSGLIDKYIEFDFKILEKKTAGYYYCQLLGGRKATTGRKDLRFKMDSEKVVATNFRVSKHKIDLSNISIPTSIKVLLEQFQNQYSRDSDICRVATFDQSDIILDEIKKSGKTLFISDVKDDSSYSPFTPDFIDLGELLGEDDLALYKKRSIEKGYKSIIISPIIYISGTGDSQPFAYIMVVSKTQNYDLEKVLEIKEQSFKLIDRIRDANTVMLPVHQEVMDLSRGGARLKVSEDQIKLYMLKSKGFVFDLLFKLQAPITIYGSVKFTGKDSDGNIIIGVSFAGNSSRKDEMKRLYALIQPMELDYKKRLIKRLQSLNR